MSHAAYINLASRLLRQLPRPGGVRSGTEFAIDLLAPLARAQLAYAGFFPHSLSGTTRIEASPPGAKQACADQTAFARAVTRIAGACSATPEAAEIIKVASSAPFEKLLADPCMLGWVYQLLLREQAPELRKGKEEIAPDKIARATQWFTPEWVGQFLVEETIGFGRRGSGVGGCVTVLDPACGAGHLLVTALRHLVEHSQLERRGAIESALRDSIFGFDIDPLMIHLTSFALYLESRALLNEAHELPIPNLFLIGDTAGGVDEIGSLWLGVDGVHPNFVRPFDSETELNRPVDGVTELVRPLDSAVDRVRPLAGETTEVKVPTSFDAVVANPPYLSHRMMPVRISRFLKEHYSSAQYDLYAAFLKMNMQILAPHGRLAMICQQSFLSIQRYGQLRSEMLERCRIEAVAQLGPGAFAAKAGEKVNNAIVVLSRKSDSEPSDSEIRFWRLLDSEGKNEAESVGLKNLPALRVNESYVRSTLQTNRSAPIALWCPREINQLFLSCEPMENGKNGIACTNGLFTCDNQRFVKRISDVPGAERHLYVPYDKGGGHKWYRTTPYLLRWQDDGEEIRNFRKSRGQSSSLPGEEFYFRSGVTYSYIGTRGFKARLLSPHSIFDIASSAVFSERFDDLYVVGFLNSALVCFLLGVLNPTINFQIGDLRRLPFIEPGEVVGTAVSELSAEAISLAQEVEKCDPASPQFESMLLREPESQWPEQYVHYEQRLERICEREKKLQSEIDTLIFELYDVSEATREIVLRDPWVVRSRQKLCKPLTLRQYIDSNGRVELAALTGASIEIGD